MFGINVDPSKGGGSKHGSPVAKPDLRNPLLKMFKFRLITAGLFVFTVATAFRIGYVQRRRKIYREFYETYDSRADFERMKRVGVFTSVKPDGSVGGL